MSFVNVLALVSVELTLLISRFCCVQSTKDVKLKARAKHGGVAATRNRG